MRRRLIDHDGNGGRHSPVSLKLLAGGTGVAGDREKSTEAEPAPGQQRAGTERHLSDQQLVDLVIGASSRAGRLSARRHLAACSLCREDLATLRGVDRQLELEGDGRWLAAIPRMAPIPAGETPWIESAQPVPLPAAAHSRDQAAGAPATTSWWQRAVVPVMVAACAVLVIKVAVGMSKPSAFTQDRAVIAGSTAEPFGVTSPRRGAGGTPSRRGAGETPSRRGAGETPSRRGAGGTPSRGRANGTGHASEMAAPSLPNDVETTPAAVEANSPAVASPERAGGDLAMSPGVSTAAPRRARTPPVRAYVDPTSRVARRRHPGAGRNDDRISPPPGELGV